MKIKLAGSPEDTLLEVWGEYALRRMGLTNYTPPPRVRVKQDRRGRGWATTCNQHDDHYWSETWHDAMEAAHGHLAMNHHHKGGQ